MRRPWLDVGAFVAAILMALVADAAETTVPSSTPTPTPLPPSLACGKTTLGAVAAAQWRLSCDEAPNKQVINFDPAKLQSLVLTHDAQVSLNPSVSSPPTSVSLSATFHRVEALVSTTLRSISIKAEPKWVHKTPVEIVPTAFTKLTALETLELQDVPVANGKLHLVLPTSIRKIAIVGCALESFSFEVQGGISPATLVEVDLHANHLTTIPDVLYSLPPNVINLDLRLNQFPVITVRVAHKPTLQKWMRTGVLQVDNPKGLCTPGARREQIQGHSQVFDVCVLDANTTTPIATIAPTTTRPTAERAASDDHDAPPATVRVPESDQIQLQPIVEEETDAPPSTSLITQRSASRNHPPTLYVTLVSVGAVSAVLAVLAFAIVIKRRRQQRDPKHATRSSKSSRPSIILSVATDDVAMLSGRRSSLASSTRSSSSSSEAMFTPLPEFDKPKSLASSSSSSSSSSNYIMSKSLQSLTGVSHFTLSSQEKESTQRQLNRDRLRVFLRDLAHTRGSMVVNRDTLVCHGDVIEAESGAFLVGCQSTTTVPPPRPLWLKVYVEQDVRVAIREYRALLVMQGTSCKRFIAQMVTTEMEKMLDGLKCAVLVIEAGSPTTFRHIVRGQLDRSQQFAIVQQLYRVVRALECLHERQFIHGAIHLDALVVHPTEEDALKFQDLTHATRFGDTIQGHAHESLELLAPEMARHWLCSGQTGADKGPATLVPSPPLDADNETHAYQVLRASSALDVWALGVLILKMYVNTKHLDEFQGCSSPTDFYLRLADPSFSLDRSLRLYIHHDDVCDLARLCLRRDPRRRPRLAAILEHRVFRAYDRLEEVALAASFRSQLGDSFGPTSSIGPNGTVRPRELVPPSLWFFLPPHALGLDTPRTVEDWVRDLTAYQLDQRKGQTRCYSTELMFPLLFLCEDTLHLRTACAHTGFDRTRLRVPASLLSLVMPLVQQSTLFLEAKAILADEETHMASIADLSGFGPRPWGELMKFYRALEKMLLAPISSFSLTILKPLEEMLATQNKDLARQVLDEVECLVFSQEKRDHVLSLLDILKTISINAQVDQEPDHDDQDEEDENENDERTCRPKEWSGLRKRIGGSGRDHPDRQTVTRMPDTRWLCANHSVLV